MKHARYQSRQRVLTILLLVVSIMLLAGTATAYELSIYAPVTVQKGMPLVVNGTSNLPAGISVDVVLARAEFTTEEVARQTVTLQATREFSVVFDTKDLTKGQFKVEVPGVPGYTFLGDSTTIRVVQVIDRSDDLTIKSPRTQEMDGTLELRGIIPTQRSAGVQVQVIGPGNEVVFGPEYIATLADGSFARDIQIDKPGTYEVSFTDSKGYIGTYPFNVIAPEEPAAVPTTPDVARASITATAQSSADHPAYFVVTGTKAEVKVSTSEGTDWIIEYPDSRGIIQKVNNRGQLEPEEITIRADGAPIYLKVYPYRFSDRGEVTIFAEGADKVGVAAEIPPVFATTTVPTQKSPLPVGVVLLAILVLAMALRRTPP